LVAAVTAEVCEDHSRFCPYMGKLCGIFKEKAKTMCPKTCGYCKEPTRGPPPHQDVECGLPTPQNSRIVGGEKAQKDAWPWQVAIYYGGQFMCGGSILKSNWILTAAHCVDGFNHKYYTIVVGSYQRSRRSGNEQVFRTVRAFHHPKWMSPSPLNNDIALIELDGYIKFDNHAKPVCLPEAGVDIPVGTGCMISGWGQYTPGMSGPPADILKQAKMKVVDQATCKALNTRNLRIPVTHQMVCAGLGPKDPTSGCHGDSGGPFVCQASSGQWVLQGSVSWGSGYCRTREGYSVFARISDLRGWIDSYIGEEK